MTAFRFKNGRPLGIPCPLRRLPKTVRRDLFQARTAASMRQDLKRDCTRDLAELAPPPLRPRDPRRPTHS